MSLAVQQEWGGPDSADKRTWLADQVVVHFYPEVTDDGSTRTKVPDRNDDIDAVEDILLDAMENEFNAQLEDDSARQIATEAVSLFEATAQGDFRPVEELVARATAARNLGQGNDDSSEDGSDDGEEATSGEAMEVDSEASSSRRPEPVIDDDGFELVQKRKR